MDFTQRAGATCIWIALEIFRFKPTGVGSRSSLLELGAPARNRATTAPWPFLVANMSGVPPDVVRSVHLEQRAEAKGQQPSQLNGHIPPSPPSARQPPPSRPVLT